MDDQTRNQFRSILKRHEDCVLHPYKDSKGLWTIGYGHLIQHMGGANHPDITQSQAEDYLTKDISSALRLCKLFFPGWDDLNPVRQIVIASMVFQMGLGKPSGGGTGVNSRGSGVMGFHDMIEALRLHDYTSASSAMLDSKWARVDSPERAKELAKWMREGEINNPDLLPPPA